MNQEYQYNKNITENKHDKRNDNNMKSKMEMNIDEIR